ncbi:MAG: alpha/beta hydrolase [Thermoleophilia bacterium]|nr:alpha/beta hydrolase [Thermoleophilia bacterium]
MRLFPSPKRLVHATENVANRVLHGPLADVSPQPSEVIDDGPQCRVLRYERANDDGPPVLVVPPLGAPAFVFDLRRGGSLAEHLVDGGRAAYLVDYGPMTFDERHLGLEHWVRYVLPRAIKAVSKDAGGRKVHLVGWCLGGTLSALTAADNPKLPVASVTLIGSPIDSSRLPLLTPLRPFINVAGGAIGTTIYRTIGTAPGPLVKRVFQLMTFDKYITRPLAVLQNLSDRDYLEQIEAVDRMMDNMIAYPGRSMGQLYHDVFRANSLAKGRLTLEGREIDLRRIKQPVLSVAGEHDGIAPIAAVHHIGKLLPGARLEIAPGGHLGVLTGRGARQSTWRVLDEFLDANANAKRSAHRAKRPAPRPRRKTASGPGPRL